MRQISKKILTDNINTVASMIVVSRCIYTAAGIRALCEPRRNWQVTLLTGAVGMNEIPPYKMAADLLVMDVTSDGSGLLPAAGGLVKRARKTILLTSRQQDKDCQGSKDDFSTVVIDKSLSAHRLSVLLSSLHPENAVWKNDTGNEQQSRGHRKEREVIEALLQGERPRTIAARLSISCAAVSRYKMIALRRIGAKNLNEVIAGNYQFLLTE